MTDRVLRVVFAGDARGAIAASKQVETGLAATGSKLTSIGGKLTRGLSLPLVAAGAAAAKTAIDFESAFTGVTKTVDGTDAQLSSLREGIRDMAKEIPATTSEIASIAEAAGALGIETDSILSFTRTMVDLGETTDLTADQAATSLARIANVMGTSQQDFDRLGSTIVDLGNNGESTESEITEMAQRIAAAGKIAGLAEADLLGIASALANVGVKAESGGTAAQKVLNGLSEAVATSNDDLEVFAETAGMTAEQFQTAWKDDAAGAFASFVAGLGEAGDGAFQILRDLGLANERTITAFLSLAASGDNLTDSLKTGQQAWKENTALANEAEKRYATTASGMEILRNNVADLAIEMSDTLLPAVQGVVKFIGGAADAFSSLSTGTKNVILGLAGIAIAAGPVASISGKLITTYAQLTTAQTIYAASTATGAVTMGTFQVALAGAVAGTTALGVAIRAIPWVALGAGAVYAGNKLGEFLDKVVPKKDEGLLDDKDGVLGFIGEMANGFLEAAESIPLLGEGSEEASKSVKKLGDNYRDGFQGAAELAANTAIQVDLVKTAAKRAAASFAGFTEEDLADWKSSVKENLGLVSGAFDKIAGKAKLTSDKIINVFKRQIEGVVNFGDNLKTLAKEGLSEFAGQTLASMGEAGAAIAQALVEGPRRDVGEFGRLLAKGNSLEANFADQTVGHFGYAADGIQQSTNAANDLIGALGRIPTNITTTHNLVTSGTVAPGTIKGRAHGGNFAPRDTLLVGERGPELLHIGGRSGSVTPNHELKGGGGDIYNIYTDGTQDGRKVALMIRQELENDRRHNARHDRTRGN